jgi:hypothetical protein
MITSFLLTDDTMLESVDDMRIFLLFKKKEMR